MPFSVMISLVLIGAGAALAAIVGLLLPRDHLLHAGASLVFGAGLGVAVLSIGVYLSDPGSDGSAAFLVASACGFVGVATFLALVWNRARDPQVPPPPAL